MSLNCSKVTYNGPTMGMGFNWFINGLMMGSIWFTMGLQWFIMGLYNGFTAHNRGCDGFYRFQCFNDWNFNFYGRFCNILCIMLGLYAYALVELAF